MKDETRTTWLGAAVLTSTAVSLLLLASILADGCESDACDPSRPEEEACGPGQMCCEGGFCCPVPPLPPCPDGWRETDDGCEPPPDGPVCKDSAVVEMFQRLYKYCPNVEQLSDCDTKALHAFVIDNIHIVHGLARDRRRGSFSVQFERASPLESARPEHWPSSIAHAMVVEELAKFIDPDWQYGSVMVVGVANPDGDTEANLRLAGRRVDAVMAIIAELKRRGLMKNVTVVRTIAGEHPAAQNTAGEFAAAFGDGRYYAHGQGLRRAFKALLPRAAELRGREKIYFEHLVNQAVLVIPLECAPQDFVGPVAGQGGP